jgi:hypothetical protein
VVTIQNSEWNSSCAKTCRENALSLRAPQPVARSNPVCGAALDCFVAFAPRNDEGAETCRENGSSLRAPQRWREAIQSVGPPWIASSLSLLAMTRVLRRAARTRSFTLDGFPDAVQRETLRRRSGIVKHSEFATIPVQQRTTSCCAAPGIRKQKTWREAIQSVGPFWIASSPSLLAMSTRSSA